MAQKQKLPPGQRAVQKMVAMPPIGKKYPRISKKDWRLRLYGDIENDLILNWEEFSALPHRDFTVDFHCVTHWSKLDQTFEGVDFSDILKIAKPKPAVKFVILEGADGYTTNVALAELTKNWAFVATKMSGAEIKEAFGGPARAVIPHLYAWKSCKFLIGMRFQQKDEPGFWETRGHHNHGDPWKEERYRN